MRSFSLPVRDSGGLTVAVLPAEVDVTNSGAVRDALLALLNREPSGLVADMSGTSFCDASGTRAVVRAHRRAQVLGLRLSVVISHPAVLRVFALTGADTVLRIFPAVEQVLSLDSTDVGRPPGRRPADGAPRGSGPQALREVTRPVPETPPGRRHGSVAAAGGGTLDTGRQAEGGSHATGPAGGPGSLGQTCPEGETRALVARLQEAVSRSGQLRSQSVGVFARLAVTYAELADLAEQRALTGTGDVERVKAMSVNARDRSIDCRQLVKESQLGRG